MAKFTKQQELEVEKQMKDDAAGWVAVGVGDMEDLFRFFTRNADADGRPAREMETLSGGWVAPAKKRGVALTEDAAEQTNRVAFMNSLRSLVWKITGVDIKS